MAKFYITTAIPYVNAAPHIGHALEFVQADAIARKERLNEKDVFFLTGTDENGQKNFQTAALAGKDTEQFVSENTQLFRDFLARLLISNDDFIHTRDKERHWPAAKKLWEQLKNSGDIYMKKYHGLYCVGHETFHSEKELINGECPDYPSKKLEEIEEENYFFRLSRYQKQLQYLIEKNELKIIPESKKNEILALIERGLEDVSFSRRKDKLPWGVPVPEDDSHVMYVWCDALSNYLSGVEYAKAGAKFQRFWPPDLQIIGKDILRFHAAIWPAMLLSAKLPLPKVILVHGFITLDEQKMSKSAGNIVDPIKIIDQYSADALRYFLLRIPTTEDGDFTEEKMKSRYNADLANGLGNLLSRTLAIGEQYGREVMLGTHDLETETQNAWSAYKRAFDEYKMHESLAAVWQLLSRVDEYLNEKEPWKLLRGHDHDFAESLGDEIAQTLSSAVLALANVAWMLQPFMPETAKKIIDAVHLNHERREPWQGRGITLKKIPAIFPRKE